MTLASYIDQGTGWLEILGGQFDQPYMQELSDFLTNEKKKGHDIYPPEALIFNALNTTALRKVKVVILGQDPYHGPRQAHGLAFSVQKGVALPPSLKNIYKEIEREFLTTMPPHGDLTSWAEQGVLLLNATLTVRATQAGSHQKRGWETFTDMIIRTVNKEKDHVVFILWGAYAQKKGAFINQERHLVLQGPHPSPLSAHRGFFGCGHFKAANDYLIEHGQTPIDWTAVG